MIDGENYFCKSVSYSDDWIMRVTGDRDYRTFRLWRSGLMHRLPACIDHATVAMALEGSGPRAVLGILMHDVGELLVPEGDEVINLDQHLAFVDHLAALSAAFWGWRDDLNLTTMRDRLRYFAPETLRSELDRPDVDQVIRLAEAGWERLADRRPDLFRVARALQRRPEPLLDALASTPETFLQGDWKMGNLGSHPDGRTILLDWAFPGAGPACWDLGWYLALNRTRLPQSKEDTVEAFRVALERRGIRTAGWYDRQVSLSFLALMVTFGWEKALGDDAELTWWADRAVATAETVPAG